MCKRGLFNQRNIWEKDGFDPETTSQPLGPLDPHPPFCFLFYFFIWKAETEKQPVIQSATIHWLTVQMPTTCGAKARSQRLSTMCRRQEHNYLNYHCCLPGFSSRGSWSKELDPGIRPRNCDVAWEFRNWETKSHPLNTHTCARAHTHTNLFFLCKSVIAILRWEVIFSLEIHRSNF